jgi:hypothetical protein
VKVKILKIANSKNLPVPAFLATIEVPASNEKGEIWIQECQCGQKQKVLFDGGGNCRSINKL